MSRAPVTAFLLVFACAACGVRPQRPAASSVGPIDPQTIADLAVEDRRQHLDRIHRALLDRPADLKLVESEGHLRLSLGDWPGAVQQLMAVLEVDGAAPETPAAAWRAVRLAGDWTRWQAFAEAQGHDQDPVASDAFARWATALAAHDVEAARAAVDAALRIRVGDANLLLAAASIAAMTDEWGRVRLLSDRLVVHADPPRPTRTLRALAMAELAPGEALAAFAAARTEGDPFAVRGEARFLLRHGRPRAAGAVLDDWLADHPFDAETAALRARVAQTIARMPIAEVAP